MPNVRTFLTYVNMQVKEKLINSFHKDKQLYDIPLHRGW